ncbi:DeoR/GlpR transcriptional regulator [Kineosporia sp. J2-2]|uniref:DeoR/GlpR transcriptional regulator n=1 Tax=Kineosporia corallincola TaxID=2835133 RepID=A0ABS5THV0_9ACTN|nr:DeoR/GlpR family DNA-binding transcription regulator [Kineosporia corallincola]MBT0770670.1 DeoR/GlpR transcriptional regulator [Kineosporia corallincola]
MFADERRQKILGLVRSNGAVSLRELARVVRSSEVTVRRDLRLLESQGLLDRRHGGAVSTGGLSHEPTYSEKSVVAAREKVAIGALAAGLVEEGDAICVGAGTTTQAFARHLTGFRELTVMTNSVLVAQELAGAKVSRGVEVVMTGGTLRAPIFALVGSVAEQALATMRVRRVFMSGNGLTAERGLSTPNLVVAGMDRAMAAAGEEIVVLADHTKIGQETMAQTVPADQIAHLVTSDRTPGEVIGQFRDSGVEVHVAECADEDEA